MTPALFAALPRLVQLRGGGGKMKKEVSSVLVLLSREVVYFMRHTVLGQDVDGRQLLS